MSGPNYGLSKGHAASAAITQFRAVVLGASEVVTQAGTAGLLCLGIAQDTITTQDATDGRIVNVKISGISRCHAGAAIAIGARVVTDSVGRVVTATAATAKQNIVRLYSKNEKKKKKKVATH